MPPRPLSLPILSLILTLSPLLHANTLHAGTRKFHPAQPMQYTKNQSSNLSLLANLEYDQEIRGLKIPAHWIPDLKQDLFIGRASIQPAQSQLWSIGWKPALRLEDVTFQGSLMELGSLLAKLSRSARTPITIEHLSTADHPDGSLMLVAENGNWRPRTP